MFDVGILLLKFSTLLGFHRFYMKGTLSRTARWLHLKDKIFFSFLQNFRNCSFPTDSRCSGRTWTFRSWRNFQNVSKICFFSNGKAVPYTSFGSHLPTHPSTHQKRNVTTRIREDRGVIFFAAFYCAWLGHNACLLSQIREALRADEVQRGHK